MLIQSKEKAWQTAGLFSLICYHKNVFLPNNFKSFIIGGVPEMKKVFRNAKKRLKIKENNER